MQAHSRTRPAGLLGLTAVIFSLLVTGSAGIASAGEAGEAREPIGDPISGHIEDGTLQFELQTVAEGHGLTAPNWGTYAPVSRTSCSSSTRTGRSGL